MQLPLLAWGRAPGVCRAVCKLVRCCAGWLPPGLAGGTLGLPAEGGSAQLQPADARSAASAPVPEDDAKVQTSEGTEPEAASMVPKAEAAAHTVKYEAGVKPEPDSWPAALRVKAEPGAVKAEAAKETPAEGPGDGVSGLAGLGSYASDSEESQPPEQGTQLGFF